MDAIARTFDAIDDIITGTITAADSGDWTMWAWIFPVSAGEGNAGRIINIEDAGALNGQLFFTNLSGANIILRAQQVFSGTTADSTGSTVLAANTWHAVFATFTAADSKIRLYSGTIAAAVAEHSYASQPAGTSTRATAGTALKVGNNSATTRTFDGRIARVGMAARLWSLDEMDRFRQGIIPVNTGSMRFLWPLDSPTASQAEDLSGQGANGTVTNGATVSEGPPVPSNWGVDGVTLVERVATSTVTATFDAPLGALTASITATVEHLATFAAPLGGLSAAATATPEHPVVLAAPLGGLSASVTATPVHPATLDAPLGGLSATIAATVEHPAVLTADLDGLTAAITATPEHPALLAAPLGSLTGTISAGPEHVAVLDAPLGALVATAAAALEHPATFNAPLGPLTATAPFVISHQALLDAQLGGLVANIAPTVQRQAVFTALLGGLHGAIVISQPDLNPLHFTYQEPRFTVTYTESSKIEHREPSSSFVYQEH